MRKFIVKNRQKRKYTKKADLPPHFTKTKTIYGMLPLFVLAIVFMATVVISQPLRDQLSHIHISISIPNISFTDPIASVVSIANMLAVGMLTLGQAVNTIGLAMWQAILVVGHAILQVLVLLDPRPLLISIGQTLLLIANWTMSSIIALGNTLLEILSLLGQGIVVIGITIGTITQTVFSAIIQLLMFIGHFIFFVGNAIVIGILAIAHLIATAAQIVGSWILACIAAIQHVLSIIGNAIGTFVSWPFKVMYAGWLQIKPYVDVFLAHIAMSGSDLSNGFASVGKVASLMGVH